MKRNNKKGFTIVELVIVIAVIAILSAVLIPTFGNVTGSAKEAARKSNARNQYTQYVSSETYNGATIDYLCDGTYHYDVDDGFAESDHVDHAVTDKLIPITPLNAD